MKLPKQKHDLYMEVHSITEYGYGHVYLYPRYEIETKGVGIEYLSTSRYSSYDPWAHLGGFRIGNQMNWDASAHKVADYAWHYAYRDMDIERIEQAQLIVATLTTLRRKMDKAYQSDGDVTSYPQYCLRVMRAIGAKGLVFKTDHGEWRAVVGAPDIIHRLRHACNEITTLLTPKQNTAA